jgi:hypothetical protein
MRSRERLEIRQALHDVPESVDVIVTKPEDFALRREIVGTIEWPATMEGKRRHRDDSRVAPLRQATSM